MSTLYLIRHGATEANLRHLYCGSTDLPLSESGKKDLRALSYSVSGARFITSGMRRTDETLKILFGDVPRTVELGLREMDFGIFEMKSYEELKDTAQYQAWLRGDNEKNTAPGGESGQMMQRRALCAFETIRQENLDTVIVTHGGVIAAVMARLFPEEKRSRYDWQPKPGYGYALTENGFRPIP